jgi:hypothetical protein
MNDYLGLLYQVIDLDVISLGDGQWHGIGDFRRDNPTDHPGAGNSNDGTGKNIREHRTATHCIHEFSSLSECFSSAADTTTFGRRNCLALQRFKLSRRAQIYTHLN